MAKVSPAKTADADADAKASGMDSDAERYRKAVSEYAERARRGEIDTELKDGDLETLKRKMLRCLDNDLQALLTKETFIGGLCLRIPIVPVRDCRLATASTDGGRVYFDIGFYTGLTRDERIFVLAHEVWHVALLHFGRMGDRAKEPWNYATDCEINYALHEEGLAMPKGTLYPSADDEGKCAEEIYEHIMDDRRRNGGSMTDSVSTAPETNGSKGGSGRISGQFDRHVCGDAEREYDKDSECGGMRSSGEGGFEPPRDKWGEKGYDRDFRPRISDDAVDRIREMVISEAQSQERRKGSIPGFLTRLIRSICTPEVRWEELLSQFVTSCIGDRRQWLPPQRRGVYGGMYFQSRRGERISVTCIVDTSGSTQGDLPKFLAELVSLLNTFGRYELTIVHCDCEVHRVDTFDDFTPFPVDDPTSYTFEGGGGSSLVPAFDEIRRRGLEPSCNIVFTDGYIDCPDENPLGVPTLFVITKDGDEGLADWGTKVRFRRGD